jgi:DNA repair exonuclease SbcCD ATPase subunit
MKYIAFKNLHITNFLSVGDTPVEIQFNRGLNIITGLNRDKEDRRNGVGKSTIADAIYFAVFGNTIRELKKEHIVNNVTQNRCEVVLEFDVHSNNQTTPYKIVRTLSPTKCHLFVDGKDETRDSISNTNELIGSVINSSPDVFQNCVIMTINNTTPFMAKKKIEKRKFIEGIFNLQVFSSMLNNVRNRSNEISNNFHAECVRYEETSNSLVSYNKQQEESQIYINAQEAKLKNRKQNNNDKINENNSKLESIKLIDEKTCNDKLHKLSDARDRTRENITKRQDKIVQLSTKIDIHNENLQTIGTEQATCPVCLRSIDKHDQQHIEDEKRNINQQLNQLLNDRDEINTIKQDLEKKLTAIKTAIKQLESRLYKNNLNKQEIISIKFNIKQLKELNEQIDDDIKNMKHDNTSLSETIKQTETRLCEIQTRIDELKKQINTYDVIKFIVSEEGVKSYIVKKILQLFNSKLAYYLKKMDANCICVFNEYFEEQIIDEKGKICSYFNFSGAERKNIDLACLFAFMDIRRLQGDVAFNFSIYDELFDSSLDEKGVELVTEILKERVEKHNECIMVISHRKESVKSATGEIIFLEKKNGITSRIPPGEHIK